MLNTMKKPKILFILSNYLGMKFWSDQVYKAVKNFPEIDPVFLFTDKDYKKAPKILKISNVFTIAWLTRKKFKTTIRKDSFKALFFVSYEPMIGLWKMVRQLPTAVLTDATRKSMYKSSNFKNIGIKKFIEYLKTKLTDELLFKKLCPLVKKFLLISKWCSKSLINEYNIDPKKIQILPWPIDTSVWKPDENKKINTKPIILFVAGDFERKGGNFLLKLYKDHLSSDCILRIISIDVRLKTKVLPKEIQLFKDLTHENLDEIIKLYQSSDLFVFPTKKDSSPIVVREALSVGLPIFITDHLPDMREVIEDGIQGHLLPYGKNEVWAKKIKETIKNPTLLKKMSENARKKALQSFSKDDFNLIIKKSIRELLTN